MWSSTPTTNKSTTASDNKKQEESDACSCSSATDASSGGQQQKQLNNFDNNSKTQTSNFGGGAAADLYDEEQAAAAARKKEQEFAEGETIDSGFISGPQTSSNFFSEDEHEEGGGAKAAQVEEPSKKKLNISPPLSSSTTTQQQKEEENFALDSGCIAEYSDEDDSFEAEAEAEAAAVEQRRINEQAAVKKQVRNELSNVAVAAGLPANAHSSKNNNNDDDQMRLKSNVDAGMSEWFCKLNLETEPTRPQQQQQQQQQQKVATGSVGINNLNSVGGGAGAHRTNTSAFANAAPAGNASYSSNDQNKINNIQSQQQQQATASNTATTNTTTITLTPANAWEKFYQQNDDGDTALHLACISGFVDVVAALIRMAPHPSLFNLRNDVAQTPLHLATLTAQPKILRMLLIAGAEPTIRDSNGNTALHLACIAGEEQCVRALTMPISASEIHEAHRQYGHRSNDKTVSYLSCARLPSDLEIRNYDGERCVHIATQAGHIGILRILVLYGADINARDGRSGRTPLHFAIEGRNQDITNFLLDECQKLNLETETFAGLTAYQFACILDKSEMQDILEKRGAEPLSPPESDYDSSDDEAADLDDSKLYDRFGDPGYFVGYNGGNFMTVA